MPGCNCQSVASWSGKSGADGQGKAKVTNNHIGFFAINQAQVGTDVGAQRFEVIEWQTTLKPVGENACFLAVEVYDAKGKAIPKKNACICGSGKKADARIIVSPERLARRLGYSATTEENASPKKKGSRFFVHQEKRVSAETKNCSPTCTQPTIAEKNAPKTKDWARITPRYRLTVNFSINTR